MSFMLRVLLFTLSVAAVGCSNRPERFIRGTISASSKDVDVSGIRVQLVDITDFTTMAPHFFAKTREREMQLELYHEHARGGFGVQRIASHLLSYRETAESGAMEWSDEGRDRAEIRAKMDAIIKESIEFVEKTGGPEAVNELMNREKQKQYDAATVQKTTTDESGSFEFKMQRNETGTFWCYAVDPANGDYWQVDVQRDPNYPGGYKKIVLTREN